MRVNHTKLLLTGLLLALAPSALASTTWYVNGASGSDSNNCTSSQTACRTIGHAISLAASDDTVIVAAATYSENPTISKSLKVIGSGASTTIIDGGRVGSVITISSATANVTLSNLTMRNGRAQCCMDGGGISNSGTLTINTSTISGNSTNGGYGGGISNSGTLTINTSTISGNIGSGRGGGIYNAWQLGIHNSTISGNVAPFAYGGGVYNGGFLLISDSTISGNGALDGGGIYNDGILTMDNSTLSLNQAIHHCHVFIGCYGGLGGAVWNDNTLTINNGTLSGNSADRGGGGIVTCCGSTMLRNSIVANNSGGNCNGTITSSGYNMSSDGTCDFHNSGDRNNTDPKLGTLGNYGGPTQTIPLLSGSPAIDAGNPSGCKDSHGLLLPTDQRGFPRHDLEDSGGCDMGAYERQID